MRRHPLDVTSLIFGLLFAVVGLSVLLDSLDSYTVRLAFVLPGAAVAVGLILIVAAVARERTRDAASGAGEENADARRDEAAGVEPGGPATE